MKLTKEKPIFDKDKFIYHCWNGESSFYLELEKTEQWKPKLIQKQAYKLNLAFRPFYINLC